MDSLGTELYTIYTFVLSLVMHEGSIFKIKTLQMCKGLKNNIEDLWQH